MSYIANASVESGLFSIEEMRNKGQELCERYNRAQPFPHIVIDDFLPEDVLTVSLDEFPSVPDPDSRLFNRPQERLKASFNPDYLPPRSRSLFYAFNSRPFVLFLENLTGVRGLIPDPYFLGGGFHEIGQGGHLAVHADFNRQNLLNLERRINVLIYLNKNWTAEYGGQLELWDAQMSRCCISIVPEFNRCVVFNTTSSSYHGNPQPVNHPRSKPRRSIALYYYTATWDSKKAKRSTKFQRRPGSSDRIDWQNWANEVVPPVILRNARRLSRLVRR